MVRLTLLSQTWPGFLDSPPAFKQRSRQSIALQMKRRLLLLLTKCCCQNTRVWFIQILTKTYFNLRARDMAAWQDCSCNYHTCLVQSASPPLGQNYIKHRACVWWSCLFYRAARPGRFSEMLWKTHLDADFELSCSLWPLKFLKNRKSREQHI